MQGDGVLFGKMVQNVLDNAVKCATGQIVVQAVPEGQTVILSVSDDGPGIPEADRARVLQRFVQLDSSRHRGGYGLGFSLVQAICTLHHGQLLLEANPPQGLRVTLQFPLCPPPASTIHASDV